VNRPLLIVGASARAAAFSALRAGFQPLCLDLFADTDLAQVCPVVRVISGYPHALPTLCKKQLPAPWIYTGGLETRPTIVDRITGDRPLWGNGAAVIRRARDPFLVHRLLTEAGLPVPKVRMTPPTCYESSWLVKPRSHVGGNGIRPFAKDASSPTGRAYFQQWIEGMPAAVIYVATEKGVRLAGLTHQLVGVSWLQAKRFHYCGSIGPLEINGPLRQGLQRLGDVLTRGCGLRGLFGVDGILRGETFWPVEINPRYTASVEVLERATGWQALAEHARAFAGDADVVYGERNQPQVGKAILFARQQMTFHTIPNVSDHGWPRFADIPAPGTRIEPGQPILSFFARENSLTECLAKLRAIAEDLQRDFSREER
jgi:uncharacterized protein